MNKYVLQLLWEAKNLAELCNKEFCLEEEFEKITGEPLNEENPPSE